MQIVRRGEAVKDDVTNTPIFIGGKVFRKDMIGAENSKYFIFGIVEFDAGSRNKFHSHTSDQILFVTSGTGIVATENVEAEVREGDTILIPEGEKHWHGATSESNFSHLQVRTVGSETHILE